MYHLNMDRRLMMRWMINCGLWITLPCVAQQSPTCIIQLTGSGSYVFQYVWGSNITGSSGSLSSTPASLGSGCGTLSYSSGNYAWQPTVGGSIQYLLAGAGGAGGQSWGGGGGAGGLLTGSFNASATQSYTFSVGAGGVGVVSGFAELGTSGGNTVGFGLTAFGGGGGGGGNAYSNNSGSVGGSGGGAGEFVGNGTTTVKGSSGTTGQGNAGGSQIRGSNAWSIAGGGGGAGSAGVDGLGTTGGTGGSGVFSSISGSNVYYCAGGGGGGYATYGIPFGHGGSSGTGTGGGDGAGNGGTDQFQPGHNALSVGSGGGGGSGNSAVGGSGKDGVVVLSYVNNAIFGTKANNTLVGNWAGQVNLGAANTFVGSLSGVNDTNGVDNIYIGVGAGVNATSSNLFSGLIAVGKSAAVPVSVLNNAINLGASSTAQASKMVIGDAQLLHLHVGGLNSWVTVSDQRLKENIRPTTLGLNFVRQLRARAYTMRSSGDARLGFIAQEIEEVQPNFPGLIKPQNKDEFYALNYESFIAPLTQSIQELDATLSSKVHPEPHRIDRWGFMESNSRTLSWAFQIVEALMALNVLIFAYLQFKCWSRLIRL